VVTSGVVDDHQVSDNTFGLFIAYVLPGFTAIHGLPLASSSAAGWSAIFSTPTPSIVDLLIVVLQATTVGLVVSAVRWLTVDTLHQRTGLVAPTWNVAKLGHGIAALELLIQIHYRYYKFYANMAVAMTWSLAVSGRAIGTWTVVGHVALMGLFLVASRDALKKYYERTSALFAS
jgi:hypothetical protein